MKKTYNGYRIDTECRKNKNGRYSVGFVIEKEILGKVERKIICDIKLTYILEVEAEIEVINQGMILIDQQKF